MLFVIPTHNSLSLDILIGFQQEDRQPCESYNVKNRLYVLSFAEILSTPLGTYHEASRSIENYAIDFKIKHSIVRVENRNVSNLFST